MLRDLVERSADRGDYRIASSAAGDLLNLLQSRGRLEEALAVAEEKAGYTGRAGLGPWTQLRDEVGRLQVLAAMGHYEEVLEEVARLRARMEGLSMESEAEETATPWNVREALLDTGRSAAVRSERWERALALNAEIVEVTRARGADALELARARFSDHAPLLRLERYDEARELLLGCRAVFEDERDVLGLGKVYSALADLEDEMGDRAAAVRFEQVALGYKYRAGQPESCAISHNNLAEYLARRGADSADVLAHRLAAATIYLQMQSGGLQGTLYNMTTSDLPPAPPAFAAVARRVERIEGVRFRALFERLPSCVPDGDAAIAAVWQLVGEEQRSRGAEGQGSRGAEVQRRREVLGSMPPAVRAAIEQEDVEALQAALQQLPEQEAESVMQQLRDAGIISGSSGPDAEVQRRREVLASMSPAIQSAIEQGDVEALQAALQQLPEQEAESVMQQLRDAGIISGSSGPDMEQVLREFGPLLLGVAAAVEDEGLRGELEPVLARAEESGWMLREAAHRIWAGERDEAALTAEIDPNSAQLVRRVLALLAG
jgi:tetratricopeptide (TPR) repeat protein